MAGSTCATSRPYAAHEGVQQDTTAGEVERATKSTPQMRHLQVSRPPDAIHRWWGERPDANAHHLASVQTTSSQRRDRVSGVLAWPGESRNQKEADMYLWQY